MQPEVFGVMVSYQNPILTKEAIHHVENQSVPVRLIVWDNGMHNYGVLKEEGFSKQVTLHPSVKNMLWTPALNAAIHEYIRNEKYILIMNNDIMLPTHAVDSMKKILQFLEGAGMVGPVGPYLGGLQDFASHYGELPSGTVDWATDLQEFLKDELPRRATYLMGSCLLIKREVWDRVGKFDEHMPLGADDFDYSIRVKEFGYGLWVAYNVYANHIGHASGAAPEWNEYGDLGWAAFEKKYDGYYASEEEAIKCLWGSIYEYGWDTGSGLTETEKRLRGILPYAV